MHKFLTREPTPEWINLDDGIHNKENEELLKEITNRKPDPEWRWVNNTSIHSMPISWLYRAEPKSTEHFTKEQLIEMGMIGEYYSPKELEF